MFLAALELTCLIAYFTGNAKTQVANTARTH